VIRDTVPFIVDGFPGVEVFPHCDRWQSDVTATKAQPRKSHTNC
jgi:hypothetical protein